MIIASEKRHYRNKTVDSMERIAGMKLQLFVVRIEQNCLKHFLQLLVSVSVLVYFEYTES